MAERKPRAFIPKFMAGSLVAVLLSLGLCGIGQNSESQLFSYIFAAGSLLTILSGVCLLVSLALFVFVDHD